jgi:hyperosmotically inducible protein
VPAASTPAVDSAANADTSPTAPATDSSTADVQKADTDTDLAASDHQITTDVKSAISLDTVTKGSEIGVSTSHGVVALTGSLPDQGMVDHLADAVGRVKDVKGVDTSALIVTSL